ncbi:MAG: anti-sigma factor [Thermomicrobiales bacterium]
MPQASSSQRPSDSTPTPRRPGSQAVDGRTTFSQRQLAIIILILTIVVAGLLVWSLRLQGDLQETRQDLTAMTTERDNLRQRATATLYRLTSSSASAPDARASVFLTIEGSGVLSAAHLPKLGTNQSYQLWYHPANGGQPIPGGTFFPDEQGNGFMLIPNDVGAFDSLSVSIEPGSGSTAPTGTIILKGDVNSARG